MPHNILNRTRICGIDFSGAQDTGKRIWIASGTIEGAALRIDECCQARDLPGSAKDLEHAPNALQELIARETTGALRLGFPFGLPQSLVTGKEGWEDFLSFTRDAPWQSYKTLAQHKRHKNGSGGYCVHMPILAAPTHLGPAPYGRNPGPTPDQN